MTHPYKFLACLVCGLGLCAASALEAQTPSYIADVDPVTPGIQTAFSTTTAGGPFAVDIYMFSSGPGMGVLFDVFGIATEFNDVAGILGLVPGSMAAPPPAGCGGGACTIFDGSPTPGVSTFDFVAAVPIVPFAPLASFGFPPGAPGPGGLFTATDGGVAIIDFTGGLFDAIAIPFPPAGTPIHLYTLMLTPAAIGMSDVAPIGIFTCPPPGPPFCGAGSAPAGPLGIFPLVAELSAQTAGPGPSYAATPVLASGFPGPVNPGTVTVTGPLPVEFTAFDALVQAGEVLLTWETATETDNAGFDVQHLQRTHETLPIDNWVDLAAVAGAGTTLEPQRYSYRVSNLPPGTHRFRIQQTDFDGAIAFTDQVEVEVEVPGTHWLGEAYPNPFNPQAQFSLMVAQEQPVTVTLHDATGRAVRTLYRGLVPANTAQQIRIDGTGLASGVYLYSAQGETFTQSRTVTLLK